MERLTVWRKDGRASIANRDGATPLQQTMKITDVIDRLAAIEDILGEEYDLDRLRDLVQADREGRVHIEEKTYQCPKCGAYRLTPRLDKQFYFCFKCKTQFTREEAEAALKGEQDG